MYVDELKKSEFAHILLVFLILDYIYAKCENLLQTGISVCLAETDICFMVHFLC